METYETKLVSFSSEEAIKSVQNEEVIAFPTETVFGFGALASSLLAYRRLVEIKHRPPLKPFTLMGGNKFNFSHYAYLNQNIIRLINAYVPGPLTLILKAKENLPYPMTLNGGTIGIRISGDEKLRNFIDQVGYPLLVPSCNISSEPPLISSSQAYAKFKGLLPYIIEGEATSDVPSTIIDCSQLDDVKLIRQGEIPFESIKELWR